MSLKAQRGTQILSKPCAVIRAVLPVRGQGIDPIALKNKGLIALLTDFVYENLPSLPSTMCFWRVCMRTEINSEAKVLGENLENLTQKFLECLFLFSLAFSIQCQRFPISKGFLFYGFGLFFFLFWPHYMKTRLSNLCL